MAKSVNQAMLLGYVGKAPLMRSTAGGTLAASLSLATSERLQDREGRWAERTEWHNLVAFGRIAEIVRDHVGKGTQLFVQGKIQTRTWDDRDSGKKVCRTEIVISDLTLLGRSPEANHLSTSNNGRSDSGRQAAGNRDRQYGEQELDPNEVPF